MNRQKQQFQVDDRERQFTTGQTPHDQLNKKLVISLGVDGPIVSSIEVDQKKPKYVLQKEYDAKSIRYANEDYSYIANLMLSRFSQTDNSSHISTNFPLFKMLRGVTKKFMFNELEIIFFLHTIEEQKWKFDEPLIQEFQVYFKQDFLSNQENQNIESYKKLLLFLICCGYTIKCFFNDANDQEILLIFDHIQSYCQRDFKKFLDQWRQKYMNGSLKTVPRVVNKLYNKLMRVPKDGKQEIQQDYNALVDQIIQISPPYSSQDGKQVKQEVKQPPPQQSIIQQPSQMQFSQQTQQSYQQQYLGNSGIFMSYSQQHPQQNALQAFNNISIPWSGMDFMDQNLNNEQIFGNSQKRQDDMMPPPPPLLNSIDRVENKIRHFQSNSGKQKLMVQKLQVQLCKMLNQQAEFELQRNKLEACFQYLQKAQAMCLIVPNLKFQTLSNLALYYQKSNQPKVALHYLLQALKLQFQFNMDNGQLANTYLNISAIQSQIDCHDAAIQNIYFSIILLQHELLIEGLRCNMELQGQLNFSKLQSNLLQNGNFKMDEYLKIDRAQILVAAYHNLSIEMEFFKKNDESKKIIESAKTLSEFILKPSHQLRIKLDQIIQKQAKTVHLTKNSRSLTIESSVPKVIRHMSKEDNQTKLKNSHRKLPKHQRHMTENSQSRAYKDLSFTN